MTLSPSPSSSPTNSPSHARRLPPAASWTLDSPPIRPYRTSLVNFTTRHRSRPSVPLPNIMTLFGSTPCPSFVQSPSVRPLSHQSQNAHKTSHILSSPQTALPRPLTHIKHTTSSQYTSQMVFFPPFVPSPSGAKMASSGPRYTYTPMWERPTASPHPNPPRKREKAIGFATNAFDPKGWSAPPTPLTSPTSTSDDASFPLPQMASDIGVPALIHAPVQIKTSHPSGKRETAMGFATNSFDPKGWTLPTSGNSSVSLNSNNGSSIASDELILSPNDTHLEQSIGQLPHFNKPPRPMRRRTEPIGFAANGWDISLPVIPIQVDTRVQSPTSPSSTNVFDWDPVYQPTIPKKAIVSKPCTKWMYKASARPKASVPTSEKGCFDSAPVEVVIAANKLATASRTDVADVGSRSSSNDSCFSLGPEHPARSPSWYSYKHITADDQVVLTEINVQEALHPKITNRPREPSPEVPEQIQEEVAALHLDVGASVDQIDVDANARVSPAEDALKDVWQKHMSLSITPIKPVDQAGNDSATPLERGNSKGKTSPRSTPVRPSQGRRRQSSAIMALRDIYSPEVPNNSPNLDRVIPTLAASIQTGEEYPSHWVDRRSIFDPDTLSSKLQTSAKRVDFDQLQGLDSPPLGPAEQDDFDISNAADHGDSTGYSSAQGGRNWRLGWN